MQWIRCHVDRGAETYKICAVWMTSATVSLDGMVNTVLWLEVFARDSVLLYVEWWEE